MGGDPPHRRWPGRRRNRCPLAQAKSLPVSTDRLVIFDCDGVLVDSEAIVIEIEASLLTEAGFAISADQVADRYVGLSYPDMMAGLERDFGQPVPDGLSETIQRAAVEAFPDRLEATAGMAAFLERLAADAVPRCVASSSAPDRLTLSLGLTGLDRFFAPEHVFSSKMVQRGKPAPDLFLLAAERLASEPANCLVVEDSPHGVQAAIAAGMDVVGYIGGLHARPSLRDRLEAAGAKIIVDTPAGIANLL